MVGWLFAALKKGRAGSARPGEGPPLSDERLRKETVETRAPFIRIEQEFEGRKGARVHNVTPKTDTNQTSLGDSVHCATHNGDPDLFKAALDRAEADLRAMKALVAEVEVKRDDMRQQLDDALRDRDDWRSQAEHWKAQAHPIAFESAGTARVRSWARCPAGFFGAFGGQSCFSSLASRAQR